MSKLATHQISLEINGKPILAGTSLAFEAGQVVALAGPNGAGKSSLLKILAGVMPATSGSVLVGRDLMSRLSPRERAQRLAYLAPDGRSAWPMTVERIVALGRAPHLQPLRSLNAGDMAAIDAALASCDIEHLRHRSFATLSSGERARTLIARTLCTGADILLLDEPTAALDPKHQLKVMQIARAEADRGALVVIAMHDLELMAAYADRVILMQAGEIRADGIPSDSLGAGYLREVFEVDAPDGLQPTALRPVIRK